MNPFVLRKKLRSQANTTPDSVPLLTSPQEIPTRQPAPESLYVKTRREAIGLGEELIEALLRNLKEGDITDLPAIWELLPFYTGVVATAKVAEQRTTHPSSATQGRSEPAIAEYLVSSLFLTHCHSFLTSQPQGYERLHIVTGNKVSQSTRTLDHMMQVALAEQSAVGARASDPSLRSALMTLDTYGLSLHGLFHSHPGQGALHTRPSSIDLATHERYERRYPLVGCIFVKDGTFRFFRYTSEPFHITICGTGVVPVAEDEHVYKLENPRARVVSDEILAPQEEG
jgi:proteasome lid subunit RPN8/RPN11